MSDTGYEYEGFVCVRPGGRGVLLEGGMEHLELADLDEQPEGFYRATVKFERLPEGSYDEALAMAAVYPGQTKPFLD